MADIDILHNYGGLANNSLTNLPGELDEIDIDNEEPLVLEQTEYVDTTRIKEILNDENENVTILSLNCQSLFAKFDEIITFISTLREIGINFNVICLQETWIAEHMDTSLLNIDGYQLISQPRTCSTHGGLALYLDSRFNHQTLKFTNLTFSKWEYQFVQIDSDILHKSIIIGNVYRLPKQSNDDITDFLAGFSSILGNLENSNKEIVICGDFNLDLLRVGENAAIADFMGVLRSNSFVPKITIPTRFSERRATLIDNIFCKLSNNYSQARTGVFTNRISDHQPYFISLDYLTLKKHAPKIVHFVNYDKQSIQKFKNCLIAHDLMNELDQSEFAA